jgi:hypothetical protein
MCSQVDAIYTLMYQYQPPSKEAYILFIMQSLTQLQLIWFSHLPERKEKSEINNFLNEFKIYTQILPIRLKC